jgi:glycosyltransferase 2 family protein
MKAGWRAALGIVLSVGLLAFTLRGVHFSDVARVLRESNWWLFLAATICSTLIFPLRARRWRTILDPVSPSLPFGPLWRATAIGMATNNVLPARVGEPARAFALTRETTVSFTSALASLVVDRIFDAIVLLSFLAIALFTAPFAPDATVFGQKVSHVAVTTGTFAAIGVAGLYLLVFFPTGFAAVWTAVSSRLLPRFTARGEQLIASFAAGLMVLRDPFRFLEVLYWAVLHWLLNAFAFWLAFKAVGITAPFSAALFLQSLISIGVSIPSSPGFFGVFEAVGREGLVLFGVSPELAVSWGLGLHILSFIPITVIGAYYAARMGLGIRALGERAQATMEKPAMRAQEK